MGVIVSEREVVANPTIVATGRSHPLGATPVRGGVNFSFFSRGASGIDLLFFDHEDDGRPSRVIPIDPIAHRTYHYWHVFVPGVQARPDLRISSAWPVRSRAWLSLRSVEATARSLWPRRRGPEKLQPRCRSMQGRQHRHRHEERRCGSVAPTTGKAINLCRRPMLTNHHLRDARARLYGSSQLRRERRRTGVPMPG